MIAVGIDPHMKTHTAVAIDTATGKELAATTQATDRGGRAALVA